MLFTLVRHTQTHYIIDVLHTKYCNFPSNSMSIIQIKKTQKVCLPVSLLTGKPRNAFNWIIIKIIQKYLIWISGFIHILLNWVYFLDNLDKNNLIGLCEKNIATEFSTSSSTFHLQQNGIKDHVKWKNKCLISAYIWMED